MKQIGPLVIVAALFMALAGSAHAGTFTAPTGTTYNGNFSMSLEGSLLKQAGFANITCTAGTISGEFTTNNETHASGPITSVSYSNCGSSTITTLNNKGTLTIAKGTHLVSATGVEITEAALGTSCVYGFGTGTALGTATNTVVESKDRVTLDFNAKIPKISGGFLCASPASWTGTYAFTSPAPSFVD